MGKYEKIPSVIEACQFHPETPYVHGEGACPLLAVSWQRHPNSGHSGACTTAACGPAVPVVFTTQGAVTIVNGDWVAHQLVDGKNDYWPISEATFVRTYKPAEHSAIQNEGAK